MSLHDPRERSRRGSELQSAVLAQPECEPATLFESSWRDFVYAEVWSRPGLERRARYLVAIAGAASAGGPPPVLEGYLRGALESGELTLDELREGALQVAVYAGWSAGALLDECLTRVASARKPRASSYAPLSAEPGDAAARIVSARAVFERVARTPSPPPFSPYIEAGVLGLAFGELWTRAALDQRARRWLTLTCVAHSAAQMPIRSHSYSTLASGDATREELHEFVLQLAVHAGWPRAAVIHGAILEMAERVAKGLPFEG
ncbi:MAG TPA: carboxymuconolactone decarboxylase family protein [Myxococcota bacterium]|nr:carboxymuconolactone decarboxylase family protein [Myxococcota bacterium]